MLARAAAMVAPYGYDEVNLNCGCPSPKVRPCQILHKIFFNARISNFKRHPLTWSAIFSGPCSMVAGKGAFGAALMMEPSLVAECVAAGACSLTICS